MLVINSENSGCDILFLISKNWCRDLNSMSRLESLCLYYISLSRPQFDVTTSFLLSASLLLGCIFSFRLQHLQLSWAFKQVATQLCWSAYFLVAMWSLGCDQVVSLISAIPVATSKICRDLIVLPFVEIYVVTSIPCRDIISVASYVDICCDHIFLTV